MIFPRHSFHPYSTPILTETTVEATFNLAEIIIGGCLAFVITAVLTAILQAIIRTIFHKHTFIYTIIKATGHPLPLGLGLLAAWITVSHLLKSEQSTWIDTVYHIFVIAEIITATWFLASLTHGVEEAIVNRVKDTGGSRWRKVQTQMQILQHVITATIWILGFAVILLTFPAARTVGTSLFASAGFYVYRRRHRRTNHTR